MLIGTYCLPTPAAEALINQMPRALQNYAAREWSKISSKQSQNWGWPSQRHSESVKRAEKFIFDLYQKIKQVRLPCSINCDDDEIKEIADKYAAEYTILVREYREISDFFQFSPSPVERGSDDVMDFLYEVSHREADRVARNADKFGVRINELHVLNIYRLGIYRALVERIKCAGFDVDVMFSFARKNMSKEEIEAAREVHLKKMCDPLFWRRWLRKLQNRGLENIYRNIGFVCARKNLYVSNDSLTRYRKNKARIKALMQSVTLINELGQQFTLEELSAVGTSNPEIRRAELMVRIAGFEYFAVSLGHAGEFVTLTCPSRFHSRHHLSGSENKKYDGSTPVQAIKYLGSLWARIRSALHRADINVYGFRVAEPHHDGTPHWHCLLFMPKKDVKPFRRIVAKYACADSRRELGLYYQNNLKQAEAKRRADWLKYNEYAKASGLKTRRLAEMPFRPSYQTAALFWSSAEYPQFAAVKSRVDFTAINWNKGTAAGYIAKYIAKNVDGRTAMGDSIGGDYESDDLADAVETAERVACWASVHGIRQFQQIGGPPVTVWRELRRLDKSGITDYDDIITRAALAADGGDWGRFTEIMGGIEIRRKDRPVQLYKEKCELPTKYGEERPPLIYGVIEPETGLYKISRYHEWEVVLKTGGKAAAWTRVNNCTKTELETLKTRPDGVYVGKKTIAPDLFIVQKYNLYPNRVKKWFSPDQISDNEVRKRIVNQLMINLNCGPASANEIAASYQPERLAREKEILVNFRNIRASITDDMAIELIKLKEFGRPSIRARDIEREKNALARSAACLLSQEQIDNLYREQQETMRIADQKSAYLSYMKLLEKIMPSVNKDDGIGVRSKDAGLEVAKMPRTKKRLRMPPIKKPLTTAQLIEQSQKVLSKNVNWLASLVEC